MKLIYRSCSSCKYWLESGPSPKEIIMQMCTNDKSINSGEFTTGGVKCSQWKGWKIELVYNPFKDEMVEVKV